MDCSGPSGPERRTCRRRNCFRVKRFWLEYKLFDDRRAAILRQALSGGGAGALPLPASGERWFVLAARSCVHRIAELQHSPQPIISFSQRSAARILHVGPGLALVFFPFPSLAKARGGGAPRGERAASLPAPRLARARQFERLTALHLPSLRRGREENEDEGLPGADMKDTGGGALAAWRR